MRHPSGRTVAGVALLAALAVGTLGAQSRQAGVAGDGAFREVLDSVRAAFDLPALAGLSLHGDSVLEFAAVGVRAVGSPERVTLDDRWHLGSLTKAMTATLAAVFVERGSIAWSTTFGDVFPHLADSVHPAFVDVRLDELLSHTGGLQRDLARLPPVAQMDSAGMHAARLFGAVATLRRTPAAERGTYLYSNAGYVVAGAMLEAVGGVPWETLIALEVFAPLGMADAGFGPPGFPEVVSQPRGHTRWREGSHHPMPPRAPLSDNPAAMGPAGTVHATLPTYARFVMAHLAGARGRNGLVTAETFRRLHTPAGNSTGYALGWVVVEREWAGGRALTHSGSNTLWYAVVWVAPARNVALIAVTNAAGDDATQATDRVAAVLVRRARARLGWE